MSKLAKEAQVYIPCPACGKTERVKLKWAEGHKTLKCRKCRERMDLRHNPAQGLIARTAAAVASFEKALDMLHVEAKKDARMAKLHKAAAKKGKKKAKKTGKKRTAKRVIRSPDLSLPPSPVDPASL